MDSKGEISKKNLVSLGEGYARENKRPKILRQLVNRLGGNLKPVNKYCDRYICIDTSYKPFGANLLCTTASISIQQELDHERGLLKGDTLLGWLFPRACFLFKLGVNPERYGWMRMIEALLRWDRFDAKISYGIVVDSELGLLPKINAREEPVHGISMLPSNMTLIYASADAGQEHFFNRLIRSTDQAAAKPLEHAFTSHQGSVDVTFDGPQIDLPVSNGHIELHF